MQILLVDPSAVFTSLLAEELSELGETIMSVHNEMDSWNLYEQRKIDLVISGMQLKHMDGSTYQKQVDRYFQESMQYPMPKFLFVTGDRIDQNKKELDSENVFGVLPRKFEKGEFQTSIVNKMIEAFHLQQKEILIVDDSELNRQLLGKILHRSGIQYCEANDGNQALLLLEQRKNRIGAVISDNYMRFMNGIELFEKMKVVGDFSHIPFLLVSGDNDPDQKMEWQNRGVKHMLSKPFSSEKLLLELSKGLILVK